MSRNLKTEPHIKKSDSQIFGQMTQAKPQPLGKPVQEREILFSAIKWKYSKKTFQTDYTDFLDFCAHCTNCMEFCAPKKIKKHSSSRKSCLEKYVSKNMPRIFLKKLVVWKCTFCYCRVLGNMPSSLLSQHAIFLLLCSTKWDSNSFPCIFGV